MKHNIEMKVYSLVVHIQSFTSFYCVFSKISNKLCRTKTFSADLLSGDSLAGFEIKRTRTVNESVVYIKYFMLVLFILTCLKYHDKQVILHF